MTISTETRKAGPFTGNDVTTVFAFDFKVFAASDLTVVRADLAGAETTLVLDTDYTASVNSSQNTDPGGSITLAAPLASGYALVITTTLEELQPTDLTNNGGFFPQVITNALDRLTILVQQLTERTSRALRVSITTPDGINPELPTPAADSLIGWNSSGDGMVNFPTTTALLGTALSSSSGSSLVGFLQSGTGAVARTAQAKMRDVVSVKDFGAVGDGVTDDTAAIQAAIDSLATLVHGASFYSGFTPGGGIVYFPPGRYKVTSTLFFKGGMSFEGSTPGSGILFQPAAAPDTLFSGKVGAESRGTVWTWVEFRKLHFVSTLFTSPYNQNTGLDLSNVQRFMVEDCYFEQWGIALKSDGSSYYNNVEHCEFYDSLLHYYQGLGSGPTTFVGGVLWNYAGSWASAPVKPDELVECNDEVIFSGTSFEPGTAVNDTSTFVCIRPASTASVAIHGGYSESMYPLVLVDLNSKYASHNISLTHSYARPLIKFSNIDLPAETITFNNQYSSTVRTHLGGGRLTDLIRNPDLRYGAYDWTLGGTATFSTAEKFLTPTGVVSSTFSGTAVREVVIRRYISAADMSKYNGRRLYIGVIVHETDIVDRRLQVQDNPLTLYKYSSTPMINYGNGYVMYLVTYQVPINNTSETQINYSAQASNIATSVVKVAGLWIWVDGIKEIPINEYLSEIKDSAAPTVGTFAVGDKVLNSAPAASGSIGWVCTTAGSPGTWKTFGTISA